MEVEVTLYLIDLSMLHRLASFFPCLVELNIGQNKLLTDSSLSSVAWWEILPSKIIKMEVGVYIVHVRGLFVDPYIPYFQDSQPPSEPWCQRVSQVSLKHFYYLSDVGFSVGWPTKVSLLWRSSASGWRRRMLQIVPLQRRWQTTSKSKEGSGGIYW